MLLGAVLAGGQSSRMGQDKGSLVLHGQTLLERAIGLLTAAGAGEVLISGAVTGYRSVPDLLPQCGPPGGLYALLDHIRNTRGLDGSSLLLVPVDMPLLTPATLQKLVAAAAGAACCHYEGEIFPCLLKATPELYRHVQALFADGSERGGKRSMKAIMRFAGAKAIPADDKTAAEFRNVNTPQDWQAILEATA